MSDAPHSLLPADIHEPYIGLKPYTEAERDRFFGRERDAQLLINKLFSHPLTLLYAPSGVGKTSLLRALVIPELRAEEAQVVYFDKWNTADPCDAVAQSMAGGPVASGQGQLAEAARLALARDGSTLVLVLDQFEEYLQRYAGDLGNLPAALGALLRSTLDLRVVLSFREEFLASVDACLRGHVLALFASTYHLEHLDRDRAREAIAAPAGRFGGECEEALVTRLLDDLAPGDPERSVARLYRGGIELPFLQIICRCLWNKSLASGKPGLRMADYLALGERRGIIAAYLHEVTRHFGLLQSLDAAQVLKALAPRSGVKIAYPLEALAAQAGTSEQRTERVLEVLREHRIVRTRDAAGAGAHGGGQADHGRRVVDAGCEAEVGLDVLPGMLGGHHEVDPARQQTVGKGTVLGLGFRAAGNRSLGLAIDVEAIDRAIDVDGHVVLGEADSLRAAGSSSQAGEGNGLSQKGLLHNDCLRNFVVDITTEARAIQRRYFVPPLVAFPLKHAVTEQATFSEPCARVPQDGRKFSVVICKVLFCKKK